MWFVFQVNDCLINTGILPVLVVYSLNLFQLTDVVAIPINKHYWVFILFISAPVYAHWNPQYPDQYSLSCIIFLDMMGLFMCINYHHYFKWIAIVMNYNETTWYNEKEKTSTWYDNSQFNTKRKDKILLWLRNKPFESHVKTSDYGISLLPNLEHYVFFMEIGLKFYCIKVQM